ncbi:NACHT domain-containing protein [Pseudomonas gessardii]|uniref:NACHT domain-containing protein n=1 Tax=Pseudomonas gessardii TaxID=78544 RepID=UPI0018D6AEE5|nr:NACHT domain-containing protein [Pseudomonas gessardii]MBH3424135.1 NACHT domain-containing protein [Pseudomonas gessardii]
MSATALTISMLSRLLTPLFKDLYAGAKGGVKETLAKLSTDSGVKKLANTLIKFDKVKTIWSPEDEVSLSKFYYPSQISIGDEEKVINSEQDLPSGNIVIEGIVGQGKSIFMRYLACSLLPTSGVKQIPLLLELRNISLKRTLQDSIYSFLKTVGLKGDEETFNYLASSGKVVLLLDGFDEVPRECVTDIIIEIDTLQTLHPELKIIISSRPQSDIQSLVGFQIYRLVPLKPENYEPFVKKLIPSAIKRTEVVDALRACPENIQGIISTPLMLTLVIVVYQTEKEIPLSLSDFFDKLFGVVFTKHDKIKAGFNRQHHSGLAERRLRQLFDAFCFMVVQNGGGRSLKPSQFNRAFDGALKLSRDCQCEVENFRKDIVKVACLLIEEGLDLTTFLHKSILDYHAAAFIKELPDTQAQAFYHAAAKDYKKWQAALSFLKSIDQVRYAKDYYIHSTKEPYDQLLQIVENPDDKELFKYLVNLGPDIGGTLYNKNLVSWGPHRDDINELEEAINSCVLRRVVTLFADAQDIQITRILEKSVPEETMKLTAHKVSIQCLIDEFGIDTFRSALRAFLNKTLTTIKEYRVIVDSEVRQESILEGILGGAVDPTRPIKSSGKQKR